MSGPSRASAALLATALLVAVAAPVYVSWSDPTKATYLLHWSVFLLQAAPYVLAAALWVPRWSWSNRTAALLVSALLLVGSLALHVPLLWASWMWGGDMVGLGILAVSGVITAAVMLAASITALVGWGLRRWGRRAA